MLDATHCLRPALHSAVIAAVLAVVLPAQPDPTNEVPRTQTVTLDFGGGTLKDFVAMIRSTSKGVNIVLSDLASEVEVPPVSLVDAPVESALRAVSEMSRDFDVRTNMLTAPQGTAARAVHIVEVRRPPRSSGPPGFADEQVSVFSLRQLTALSGDGPALDAATVLTAIEQGLAMVAAAKKPELRFHADSGLLFVHGTSAQLSLVHQVLGTLTSEARGRPSTPPAAADPGEAEAEAKPQAPRAGQPGGKRAAKTAPNSH